MILNVIKNYNITSVSKDFLINPPRFGCRTTESVGDFRISTGAIFIHGPAALIAQIGVIVFSCSKLVILLAVLCYPFLRHF